MVFKGTAKTDKHRDMQLYSDELQKAKKDTTNNTSRSSKQEDKQGKSARSKKRTIKRQCERIKNEEDCLRSWEVSSERWGVYCSTFLSTVSRLRMAGVESYDAARSYLRPWR